MKLELIKWMNKEKYWNNENNEINGKHEVNDPMSPWPHASMPQLNERVVHWNLINKKVIWKIKWNKVSKLNKFVKTIKFTFDNVEIDKI